MSSDLLFSILPRQGTVPIAHDELKVEKVTKESALRELNDKEQALHLEEREARQQQQSLPKKKKEQDSDSAADDANQEQANEGSKQDPETPAFTHLDVYV
ncbi:MAG: hypothetical protein GW763_13035 [Paraglaciecola sp.]|jgi:hypothetical protein|nr:hypothetical protein [Paraglaciecola sp.]NCT48883.1 hypothetical protein [Paraglaciecola sp.]